MNLGKTQLGDIVPAMYPIPQNPVTLAYNAYQAAQVAAGDKGMSGLGYFVPGFISEPVNPVTGSFADPQGNGFAMSNPVTGVMGNPMGVQNPIRKGTQFNAPKQLERPSKNALVDAMARAKYTGAMGSGMGNLAIDSLTNFETSLMSGTSFGVSNLMLVGGGLLALVVLMGSKGRR